MHPMLSLPSLVRLGLLLFAATMTTGLLAAGRLIYAENFNAASTIPGALGAGSQGGGTIQLSSDPAHVYGGSGKSLRGTYPAQTGAWGGTPVWASINLTAHQTDHFYLRFRVKIPGYKYGSKFLKVFSINDGTRGYANTTFGLNNDASMYLIYGDGTQNENDAANKINFDGAYPQWTGRAYGLPGFSLSTPQMRDWTAADWGEEWHLIEIHMKFNSGTSAANEINNGEYLVRIDGQTYVDAKGLFNRHYSNQPIESIGLFGWSQGDGPIPGFEIWIDDLQVSLDGWVDTVPDTTAPSITTTTLPSASTGTAYSQNLAATGGDGDLAWNLASGSLPAGLTLSSSGVISGTPTATGTANFTVRVIDSDTNLATSDADTQLLTLTVSSIDPYTQWKTARFGANAGNTAISGDDRDPDGDGLTNLFEYATGGDPLASDPALIPVSGLSLRMTFTRLDPAPVTYSVEASPDLTNWTSLATLSSGSSSWTTSGIVVAETGSGSSRQVRAYTDVTTTPSAPKFLRLKITRP
jgi:hypothetical protein